jgi:hypothetical protein
MVAHSPLLPTLYQAEQKRGQSTEPKLPKQTQEKKGKYNYPYRRFILIYNHLVVLGGPGKLGRAFSFSSPLVAIRATVPPTTRAAAPKNHHLL